MPTQSVSVSRARRSICTTGTRADAARTAGPLSISLVGLMMMPSTRRLINEESRSASTCGLDCASQSSICSPRSASTRSTFFTSAVKNGLAMSGTTMPTVSVRLRRSELAMPLLEYPSSATASSMRRANSGDTVRAPDSARDTVAVETPARSATCLIVGRTAPSFHSPVPSTTHV